MDDEQFYARFNGLDEQISVLDNELSSEKAKIGELEKNLSGKRFVQKILNGLKSTPSQNDPGKYMPAYYFVKRITPNNVERSDEPSSYKECLKCKEERVVVMSYEQTEDSPMGDTWTKQVFTLCLEDGAYNVKEFSMGGRF